MKGKGRILILIIALVWIIALGAWGSAVSETSKAPVYWAVVDDLSGPYSADGTDGVRGVTLALEDHGMTILGHPIKLVTRDTELRPAVGVRRMREVINKYHPICLHSGASSAVQLAMTEVAKDQKTLFWTGGWDSRLTGEAGHRYVFSWNASNFAIASSSVAGFLKLFPDVKTAYHITADYAWGYDMEEKDNMIFKKRGVKVLGHTLTPLGGTDYSAHITKALAAKPDVIVLNVYGNDLMNCAKQAAEFGAKEKCKILIPGDGLTMLRGIGAKALEGMYAGTHWWWKNPNDWSKNFTAKWLDKYGMTPSYYCPCQYTVTSVTLNAMEKAGSTDPKDVIPILEGMTYDGPSGKETIRAWDHQVTHPFLLGVGKKPEDMTHPDDFLEIVSSAAVYRSHEENPVNFNKEPL